MKEWFSDNWKWATPVGILIIIGIILAVIFISKYKGPGENCVFINENANLHNEYVVKVLDVEENDQIEILLNKDDIDKHSLYSTDTHYIAVTISIKRANTTNPKEDHVFDNNDFKLKDHTGVKIKNIYFGSVKDGSVLSQSNFRTKSSLNDYCYIGNSVNVGEEKEFVIYFEVEDKYSVYNTVMVLEIDFFVGWGNNKGTDIVLANRKN